MQCATRQYSIPALFILLYITIIYSILFDKVAFYARVTEPTNVKYIRSCPIQMTNEEH